MLSVCLSIVAFLTACLPVLNVPEAFIPARQWVAVWLDVVNTCGNSSAAVASDGAYWVLLQVSLGRLLPSVGVSELIGTWSLT